MAAPQADLGRENERLRLENRVLRNERVVPKKGHSVLREPKAVKFAFVHNWRQSWPTRRQAEAAIFQYINGFYSSRRRHSNLGSISPLAFEIKVA